MSSKIKIILSNNNVIERKYIIHTIFSEFLGLEFDLVFSDNIQDYFILLNNKKIVFKDDFWNKYPESLSYLNRSNFPIIQFGENDFIVENDIPILYGSDEITILPEFIYCGIDIFASSFFMLTRWEEYINTNRDNHTRFSGTESLAFKKNFLHRPIVNEYIEMLWNMLIFIGYKGIRKKNVFELVLTHDIDLLKQSNPIRSILRDILKYGNFKLAFSKIHTIFKDPVDTFSFLMDTSEEVGIKSYFYFMSVSPDTQNKRSNNYLNTLKFKRLISEIVNRGHIIGFHPGYFTYNDEIQWVREKNILENALGFKVYEGRQHFLKMDIPYTLKIWNDNEMKIDSTLSYADKEGYRCGTGDCFYVFDFLNRKELDLVERPLIVMDGSFKTYQNMTVEQAKEILEYYIATGKKYRMKTTFLFHNSSFDRINWRGWKKMYKTLLLNNLSQ